MPRSASTFKQRHLTQALQAAKKAGLKVARYDIDPQGNIVVILANDNAVTAPQKLNDWEDVR
jgi:hypothetical protein